jgi:hypothetical protein
LNWLKHIRKAIGYANLTDIYDVKVTSIWSLGEAWKRKIRFG